jgi:hypothetical protein
VIVLDTNVLSEGLRPKGNLAVRSWLNAQDADSLFICAPVLAEIRFGVERLSDGPHRERLRESAERLENETFRNRILPFDAAAATVYARITAMRHARGKPIGIMDGLIAAIALSQSAAVATRDHYGFADLDLTVINPFDYTP